jgi:hypothetical protein|tara:strand:+ start:336 stop:776 length:441 start_codon:yes stop_codon:yes gene_type:complete
MKILMMCQDRENYGAHDWDDATTECPQYWKNKGGNTYIIENVTVAQGRDEAFWQLAEAAIESSDDYFSTHILQQQLVDDDYDTSKWIEGWETPIRLNLVGEDFHAERTTVKHNSNNDPIITLNESWLQESGQRLHYMRFNTTGTNK